MAPKVERCSRCQRRHRNAARGWNVVFAAGFVTGFLCPNCQTPEENAEAEINEATLDYSRSYTDSIGRLFSPARGEGL